jgi:hypothetical protein
MVLESQERVAIKFGVTRYVACGIDECDPMSRRGSSGVGKRIGIDTGPPLHSKKPRFAGEVVDRLICNPRVKLLVDDDYDRDNHRCDDHERLKKQPLREFHERSLMFFIR